MQIAAVLRMKSHRNLLQKNNIRFQKIEIKKLPRKKLKLSFEEHSRIPHLINYLIATNFVLTFCHTQRI